MKIFMMCPDYIFLSNTQSELKFLLDAECGKENVMLGRKWGKDYIIYKDGIFYATFRRKLKTMIRLFMPQCVYTLLIKIYSRGYEKYMKYKERNKFKHPENCKSIKRIENIDQIVSMFRDDLNCFCELCRARKISVILATQANRFAENSDFDSNERENGFVGYNYFDYASAYKKCNDVIREVSVERNLILVDLENIIDGSAEGLMYDFIHYTNKGARRAAKEIAEVLGPLCKDG